MLIMKLYICIININKYLFYYYNKNLFYYIFLNLNHDIYRLDEIFIFIYRKYYSIYY